MTREEMMIQIAKTDCEAQRALNRGDYKKASELERELTYLRASVRLY